ncbi:MAG: ChaN family lipoprotein, partial [Acaryochloridaceae cyanobacterium RL_2_7]|nr:ChaN family lipoprotein [Acaryochloridaceae cyanobacterium RL_2_7]
KYIPAPSEIDTSNEAYKAYVSGAFGGHGGHGSHGNLNFDNFFAAQVTWDETMAAAIAAYQQENPKTQVVVLAGQGHVIYGFGIPSRVKRRLPEVKQKLVILNPSDGVKQKAIAPKIVCPLQIFSGMALPRRKRSIK